MTIAYADMLTCSTVENSQQWFLTEANSSYCYPAGGSSSPQDLRIEETIGFGYLVVYAFTMGVFVLAV